MNDIQQIEALCNQIKELSQDPSSKTRTIISKKFQMISSLAQTMHLVYSTSK